MRGIDQKRTTCGRYDNKGAAGSAVDKGRIRCAGDTVRRDSGTGLFFPWIGGSILLDIWCFKRRNDIGEDNLQDALREELRQYRFVCLKVKEREYVIFVEAPDSHSQMEKKRYLREFILSVQGVFSSLLDTQTAVAIGGEVKGSRDIPAAKKRGKSFCSIGSFGRAAVSWKKNRRNVWRSRKSR